MLASAAKTDDGNLCMTCREPFVDDDGNSDDDDEDDDEEYIDYRIEFVIFKLDMDTKSWEKIYSLGDRSLFLGNCCTFTVAAADYPGCKPSCIYYTDELTDVEVNGIYEVEKYLDKDIGLGSLVQPFPKSELMEDFFPPLCWIIPYPL
ncbi:F-box protein SKIP23-like isoform X2 [Gossypium arboreum]|uniref:F-box protein SKIP23-like isoform X2 n=1 Tax=Gossypium arboreum TaxID=29729 RepID=UPI00081915CA|nr:F-box protein SKIP23-like isoform X2 [Gossypium arboreum]